MARTPWRIRMLAGFRYFEVDDDFNINNEVTGNAVAENPSTGSPLVSILSGSTATQLLDLEWAGSVSITRNWSIYGGYQGLIAQGVGLATSQSRDSSLFSPTNPITFDDPQWHGYKLGVVATF